MATITARISCPTVVTSRISTQRFACRPTTTCLLAIQRQGTVNTGALNAKAVVLPCRTKRASRSSLTVSASEMTYEIAPEGAKDYTAVLGVITFIAAIQGRVAITAALLLKSLAILQLLHAVTAVATRKFDSDTVAAVVGPAVLAVAALNLEYITYLQAANALFGYYLCEKLEGSFWVWVATLAGAMYAGVGLEWYAGAFALWQSTRLVRGGQNNTVPLLTIPALAVAAWAFWKEQAQLLAVTLFIAHTVASGLGLLEEVTTK